MTQARLFDTVSDDRLQFGIGQHFDAKRVAEWLSLDKQEVSRIASVSPASVRYDVNIPKAVRERLEEIGNIANMVTSFFNGDAAKAALWFRTKNPMLGDISPRDMVRLGRFDRLRRYVVEAYADRAASASLRDVKSA